MVDDEPAAEPQQHGAGHSLQEQGKQRLPPDNPKVLLPEVDIFRRQLIRTVNRHVPATTKAKRVGALRDFFQPGCHIKLCVAFVNRRRDAAEAQHTQQKGDQDNQHQTECQQIRVVEREHGHADDRDHHDTRALDKQRCQRLLLGRHFEETIDDVGWVPAVERFDFGLGKASGKCVRRTGKDSPLHVFDGQHLHGPQHGCKAEKREHHQGEHNHRPQQHAKSDHVHQRFDCCRCHDRQKSDPQRERQDHKNVLPLHEEDGPQAGPMASCGVPRGI